MRKQASGGDKAIGRDVVCHHHRRSHPDPDKKKNSIFICVSCDNGHENHFMAVSHRILLRGCKPPYALMLSRRCEYPPHDIDGLGLKGDVV